MIKVYDRPKALFYLDPPYYGAEQYYDVPFTEKDHIRLKDTLMNINGQFILSYNDNEFIRNLYKEFNVETVSRNSNLTCKRESKNYDELIIRNFE